VERVLFSQRRCGCGGVVGPEASSAAGTPCSGGGLLKALVARCSTASDPAPTCIVVAHPRRSLSTTTFKRLSHATRRCVGVLH
jgi:hypothetical protein